VQGEGPAVLYLSSLVADKTDPYIGFTPFTFAIQRDGDLSIAVSVAWAVSAADPNPADPLDFAGSSISSGVANLAAGQSIQPITLNVVGDGSFSAPDYAFSHDRERHFPDAWIKAGRFAGSDRSRILDRIEIHSFPVQAVEEAIAFVLKHSWHGATIGAVVHTDYSQRATPMRLSIFDDRLEIENAGLLPFGLTVEALPHGVSKLRDRVIGRVFQALGLIEQWASGIRTPSTRPLSRVWHCVGPIRFINSLDHDPRTRAISANLPHPHRLGTRAKEIGVETLYHQQGKAIELVERLCQGVVGLAPLHLLHQRGGRATHIESLIVGDHGSAAAFIHRRHAAALIDRWPASL
jgi:hypothetical protein